MLHCCYPLSSENTNILFSLLGGRSGVGGGLREEEEEEEEGEGGGGGVEVAV